MKTPFTPADPCFQSKPLFLEQLKNFTDLCERQYGAVATSEGACSIQYGVQFGYRLILESSGIGGNSEGYGKRAINFHLTLHYREKSDGVCAAIVQPNTLDEELAGLRKDVEALLNRLKDRNSRSASPPTANPRLKPSASSAASSTGVSSNNEIEKLILSGDGILRLTMALCELAGAELDPLEKEGGNKDRGRIRGSYAGIQFCVCISGIFGSAVEPDEYVSNWEVPKNARQRPLPGIRSLVNVVDAGLSSIKFIAMLHQARNGA